MTKFLTKAALAATVATGLFAAPAMAADTEEFTATARIVSPLTLTLDNGGLDFGTITILPTLAAAGEDVVVGRVGGGSDACGANLNCTAPTPAIFVVTGSINQGLDVSITPPATLDSGANTVAFTLDAPATVSLDAFGDASFDVGGTIRVLPSTVDGTYSATMDVTVEYS